MAGPSLIWNTFNAGELSPLIDGRTDQEKYFAGCKTLRNFIPTVQGPATRRGGTRYIGASKSTSERAWLMPFEFNQAQSYVLELTDTAMRFWVNRGQLLSGGSPYEISTPWSTAELVTDEGTFALRSVQSGDVMWLCHYNGAEAPQKLSRLGATNWTLTDAPFANGPFEDIDPDETITVTASGVTGTITLTATSAIFSSDDVGTPFYMEQKDSAGIVAWEPSAPVALNDVVRYEGNYYKCTDTGPGASPGTGSNPPVHTEGRVWDGSGDRRVDGDNLDDLGVEWEYLHSGYGWVQITAVGGGGTTATATVTLTDGRLQLPTSLTTSGTLRWAKSAFSEARGWPTAVTFFRERLVYARGRQLFFSVVGDYDNFSAKSGPDVTKETAIKLSIASDRLDLIRWITPNPGGLLIGTARNEIVVAEQTTTQVFAADNVVSVPQTEYGSRLLEPLRVGNAVLFLQRAGRKLRELIYDYTSDRYKADDLTVLSEHVVDAGIIDMDYQQEPETVVWCVLADGEMAALTYNKERGVIAWVPHALGGDGFVESIAVIPKSDGRRDDVWLAVRRTINGSTVRYIEVIEDERLGETDTGDMLFGDCGISYDGVATTVIGGLDHLAGETVQVLAGGASHADCVVTDAGGGNWQITLNRSVTKAQIGFDEPARLQPMRLEAAGQQGTAQGKRKSIAKVRLRLVKTIGGRVGRDFDNTDPIPGLDPSSLVGTPPSLYTGDRDLQFNGGYDTDGYVCVESWPMMPMTVAAIIAVGVEVNDD